MTPGEPAGAPAIEVVVTPYGMGHLELGPRAVVVIDVLRACTTIAHALDAGARGVVPAETVEDAMRLAQTLGRDSTVLGGERGGERIDGFERGNSPLEYGPDVVAGRTIVLTTSNGARALAAASEARTCLAATFVNLSATARRLADHEHVTIVCAGSGPRFSLEDFVCAGWLARELRRIDPERQPDDGARAAEAAAAEHGEDLPGFLRSTDHGRRLIALGFEPDLDLAAEVDRFETVPELRDGLLTAAAP